ncbi:uncharacterized protein LOC124139989 isoform X2 [Haliotis rufescens]|uniref:uncharacterized protein LOC124139989 isoform X2 n=1 Tax=Haliotis rufescens TaxID=6454 RepID=UPI00201EB3BE|nr:uncharacterized protein LOC124139989 isoform X2 [Haliotis rufescens]
MTKSMIVWKCFIVFGYMLQPVYTGATQPSKACYGSAGNPCTRHDISCNSTQKIAIYDAYYTNNTGCAVTGLSNCDTVNPDNVTEHGYHRFNNTELVSLYNNCSTENQCVYRAPRRGAARAFSVVEYQCIKTSDPVNVTCEPVTGEGTNTGTTISSKDYNNHISTGDTGAIIGGVVATVVAILVVTLVSVWLIRNRRAKGEGKEKTASFPLDVQPGMAYSLAGKTPQNNYHEIQDLKTQSGDYDYATADGMEIPQIANTYFILEQAEKQNAEQFSKASTTESDYDHIGVKASPQTSGYDTTASVAQPSHTGGTIGEDNYGYNLFHKKTNPQIHQNDYDTAASATKAVAQLSMTDRNTDDDDYDHFPRVTNHPETVSSPYDTASGMADKSDYSIAGPMK